MKLGGEKGVVQGTACMPYNWAAGVYGLASFPGPFKTGLGTRLVQGLRPRPLLLITNWTAAAQRILLP